MGNHVIILGILGCVGSLYTIFKALSEGNSHMWVFFFTQ